MSKVEVIFDAIQKRITSGDWKTGDKILPGARIAEEFDCSIGTVNKAFSLLAHEGLLQRKPKVGTRVSYPSEGNHPWKNQTFCFLLLGNLSDSIWTVIQGFSEKAGCGKQVLTISAEAEFSNSISLTNLLATLNASGLVICPGDLNVEQQLSLSKLLNQSQIPTVSIGGGLHESAIPSIMQDSIHAGYEMTRYLVDKGCKKIGFACSSLNEPMVKELFCGYRWAMKESGFVDVLGNVIHIADGLENGPIAGTNHMFIDIIKQCERFDAIICASPHILTFFDKVSFTPPFNIRQKPELIYIEDLHHNQLSKTTRLKYQFPFKKIGQEAYNVLSCILRGETLKQANVEIQGRVCF